MKSFPTVAITLALSAVVAAALPASAQVNLLANGSFESPVIGGPFQQVPPGTLTNWTVGGAGVDHIGSFWQASDGVQSVDLSALGAGSISQTVATTVGSQYLLLFDMAGNPDGGDPVKDMVVAITGQAPSNQQFVTTGFSRTNMGWSLRNLPFIASNASTTITFTSQEANAFGPALDNVRLFLVTGSNVAPEPGTLTLLGSSVIAVVIARRRFRRRG
jgi:choice-of-anchor C domain-containing protein